MALGTSRKPRGDVVALVGIGAMLLFGIVTVVGAALGASGVFDAGPVVMVVTAFVFALFLYSEGTSRWRVFQIGLVGTTLCALIAFVSFLNQNAIQEGIFLVATCASGVTAILGFRSGMRSTPESHRRESG